MQQVLESYNNKTKCYQLKHNLNNSSKEIEEIREILIINKNFIPSV